MNTLHDVLTSVVNRFGDRVAFDSPDGQLTFRPYFHKADFHNLCYLLNKRYIEVEAEMYEGFRSRNPISRMKVFVNGNKLVSIIAREYGENLKRSGSWD